MHIAIAGNIGSGKTTLTKMLAAHYGWTPKFESVDFNPYLSDFYADMERWSFNLQIYFLNKRFKDVVDISRCSDVIIQDRDNLRGRAHIRPEPSRYGIDEHPRFRKLLGSLRPYDVAGQQAGPSDLPEIHHS